MADIEAEVEQYPTCLTENTFWIWLEYIIVYNISIKNAEEKYSLSQEWIDLASKTSEYVTQ